MGKLLQEMNILHAADIHTKLHDVMGLKRSMLLFECLEQTMKKENCDKLVINGDLWDDRKHHDPEVMHLIDTYLMRWANQGIEVFWLRGNHEVPATNKLAPEVSMIRLWHGKHENLTVINKPMIVNRDEHLLCFLPWYPAETFINAAAEMAKRVGPRLERGARSAVLFAHIGLAEGNVSASNVFHVSQKVELRHLKPKTYDWVLLGDYHLQQKLGRNAYYAGSPMQHAHGDAPDQDLFLLEYPETEDDERAAPELCLVPLEGRNGIPRFITLESLDGVVGEGMGSFQNDILRVRVSPDDAGRARALFPQSTATIEIIPELRETESRGRLHGVSGMRIEAVLDVWLSSRGLASDINYKNTAMRYIRKAAGHK